MINQGKDVPEKTLAVFPVPRLMKEMTEQSIYDIIKPSPQKREWFNPHFYRCLPLTIGNQYGFTIYSGFEFTVGWDGRDEVDGVTVEVPNSYEENIGKWPAVSAHFGYGIVTLTLPFDLRTPPGVNLMTINPTNVVLPLLTVMTGVVETDNLRRDFTINLRLQIPNTKVTILKGTPLATLLPIPRYFADEFKLTMAEELFDSETVKEEIDAEYASFVKRRDVEKNLRNKVGKDYMRGQDVYGNKFPDHQRP